MNAVDVVVIANDAIEHFITDIRLGLHFGNIGNLAVCAEAIQTGGEGSSVGQRNPRHELLAQVQLAVLEDLVAVVKEVVITLIFEQQAALLLDTINVVVIIDDAVLGGIDYGRRVGNLAIRTKAVQTGGEGITVREDNTGHEFLAQVQLAILKNFVAVVEEVVIALILEQQVALLLNAVNVVVIADNTVQHFGLRGLRRLALFGLGGISGFGGIGLHIGHIGDLAVSIEDVQAFGEGRSIRQSLTHQELLTQVQLAVLKNLVTVIKEVVIAFILDQLIAGLQNVIDIEVVTDNAVQRNVVMETVHIIQSLAAGIG